MLEELDDGLCYRFGFLLRRVVTGTATHEVKEERPVSQVTENTDGTSTVTPSASNTTTEDPSTPGATEEPPAPSASGDEREGGDPTEHSGKPGKVKN